MTRARTIRLAVAWLAVCVPADGQDLPAKSAHASTPARCADCHACAEPTATHPCLRRCTRDQEQRFTEELEARQGPRVVILNELEDVYLPVPFDHAGHAAMAQMARGCATCHHYTPEGAKHPACKACHSRTPGEGDIRKPGLKGAYHRQCMSCHREWGGETNCGLCHQPKTRAAAPGGPSLVPTTDDLIGRMHPPIPEPDVELYTTAGDGIQPGHVLFRHKDHIHRFGLNCADCHREDNCTRCHEAGRNHVQRPRTFEDHHQPCASCHRDDSCGTCHYAEGRDPPPPFNHASTGWPLSLRHRERSCRDCHRTVPFARLDRNCTSCHSNWTPGAFDHAATGLRLDQTHAAIDCTDCHTQGFEKTPSCTECHDEDEGVAFPAKLPGTRVAPAPP